MHLSPRRRLLPSVLAALALSSFVLAVSVRAQTSSDPVAFRVSFPRPTTHLLEVEMRVPVTRGTTTPATAAASELVMPVWTPGSYMVREFARNVQDFTVTNESGRPLPWRKTSKNVWRVETGAAKTLVARYRVYANVLTVREAEVTDAHAFWNNAAVLMHVRGRLDSPATLSVAAPKDWKVATALPAVAGQTATFRAPNFDLLYDSPVEAGTFEELTFTAGGKPHRIIIDGKGNYDPARLKTDFGKIVGAASTLMGADLPYEDYTFFLHLRASGGGGGLEHLNSTALGASPRAFSDPERYTDFLTLVAHEYFHLWNVKRIRPDVLGPFNYETENYTRLLWVAEGVTSYYENLLTLRAGLMDAREFLQRVAGEAGGVEITPGRKTMSLEEASFDAWIKYYRPDENSPNSQISYYNKGAVVGMLLDLTIRNRTEGAKSLDDVMRTLYTEYGRKGRNYTSEDFQRLCEQVSGSDLREFFTRYVRGREELDYDTAFRSVGLTLLRTMPNANPEAYLGADWAANPAGVSVRTVREGTPAWDEGLSAGDLVIAVDGERVQSATEIVSRIDDHKPGDTLRFTLFRNDQLRNLEIKLGSRVPPYFVLVPRADATPAQMSRYREWTGSAYPARR